MIERTEFLKNDEWLKYEIIPDSKKKSILEVISKIIIFL